MPYPPRYAPPGQYLHVRTRATGGEALHRDHWDYEGMAWHLGKQVLAHELGCIAYCLMPTHIHLVLRPKNDNVSVAVRKLLSGYALRFNKRWERSGHLVECRFRCKPARSQAHLFETMRYVARNPVRAKLCVRPEQWPYSSYAAAIGEAEPPIWLDLAAALRLFDRNAARARAAFRDYVDGRPF